MALSFKPVDTMPGSQAHESRDLFTAFLASGARFGQVEGATAKDRSRLASAAQSFNRKQSGEATVKVRARGEDTYLERVEPA
jgi:hypothetical protein